MLDFGGGVGGSQLSWVAIFIPRWLNLAVVRFLCVLIQLQTGSTPCRVFCRALLPMPPLPRNQGLQSLGLRNKHFSLAEDGLNLTLS